MNLLASAIVAVICAASGVLLGYWFSRQRSPYWAVGFAVPIVLLFAFALAVRVPAIMFAPPFSWMMLGMKKFSALGLTSTLVLTTPLSRIPKRRDRVMVVALIPVVVFFLCLFPFIAPLLARNELRHLQTKIDGDGICLQTTAYTCGPASAVTALRKLQLPAEEGQIGILSYTSYQEGTSIDTLGRGLEGEYARDGLQVKCRAFKDVSELRQAGLTIAQIRYSLLEDHWVTVLGVTDSEVITGDPLAGLTRLPHAEFCKKWRFIGIVLARKFDARAIGPAAPHERQKAKDPSPQPLSPRRGEGRPRPAFRRVQGFNAQNSGRGNLSG